MNARVDIERSTNEQANGKMNSYIAGVTKKQLILGHWNDHKSMINFISINMIYWNDIYTYDLFKELQIYDLLKWLQI